LHVKQCSVVYSKQVTTGGVSMSAGGSGFGQGVVTFKQMRDVVAYKEDVHVWVYYDQTDDILRYEAYVIDYDDDGKPSTLAFVVDDGILPWNCALGDYLTKKRLRSAGAKQSLWDIPRHTKATLSKPEYNLYLQLDEKEKSKLHHLFAREEVRLKAKYRSAWQKRLRALGYDVIPSAY